MTTRGPGRPKGLPKTGGRRPASDLPVELRPFVNQRGRPLEFLAAVAAGRKVSVADPENYGQKIRVYPTMEQRVSAARVLAAKLMPDLKAVEGAAVNNVQVIIGDEDAALAFGRRDPIETARRLAFILADGYDKAKSAGRHDEANEIAAAARSLSLNLDGREEPTSTASLPAPDVVDVEPIVAAPVGHVETMQTWRGGEYRIELSERLPDGRERWTATIPSQGNRYVASAFGRERLVDMLQPAQLEHRGSPPAAPTVVTGYAPQRASR